MRKLALGMVAALGIVGASAFVLGNIHIMHASNGVAVSTGNVSAYALTTDREVYVMHGSQTIIALG